jgi:hypothetical protein
MTPGRIAREVWWMNEEFLPSISFHYGFPYSYITWGMNNKPIGGPSSETYSHHIDITIRQFEVSESSIPYKTAVTGKFFIIKKQNFQQQKKVFFLQK